MSLFLFFSGRRLTLLTLPILLILLTLLAKVSVEVGDGGADGFPGRLLCVLFTPPKSIREIWLAVLVRGTLQF